MHCRRCGRVLKGNERYCSECGEAVSSINKPDGRASNSLVIGIISLLLSGFNIFILPLAIIGLISGIRHKGKSSTKTIGIVLNTISIVIIIIECLLLVFVYRVVVSNNNGESFIDKYVDKYIDSASVKDYVSVINDWKKYSNLRSGELGEIVDLNGGWRILSDDKNYVVFKDDKYYKYDSIDDMKSYTVNSVTIDNGREGLKKYGLSDDGEIGNFINNISKYIQIEKLYIVNYDSSSKSKDNIEIWILIDHDREGIQAINISVADKNIKSYVKYKDN